MHIIRDVFNNSSFKYGILFEIFEIVVQIEAFTAFK